MMVQTGAAGAVLAGGVESMSSIEYYSSATRWGSRSGSTALYDRLGGAGGGTEGGTWSEKGI